MTLINQIMLYEPCERLTEPLMKLLQLHVEKTWPNFCSAEAEKTKIKRLRTINDFANYVTEIMKTNDATIWMMLPIIREFEVFLDKVGKCIPEINRAVDEFESKKV